jgi:hypothetical protein
MILWEYILIHGKTLFLEIWKIMQQELSFALKEK